MSKKYLAASLLALSAPLAYAQTNVTIYGTVDTGFIKETGSDVRMDENNANLIGFTGTEDLGNGVKATFQLEKQFQLNDGTNKQTYSADDSLAAAMSARQRNSDFTGAANVGLSGAWGQVRLGRVNEMSVEYFTQIDPFEQGSTGSSLAQYALVRSEQISNTLRYDSADFSGFSFGLTYSLGSDTQNRDRRIDSKFNNDGFGVSLRYENGPLYLTSNFNRQADSDRSFVYNVGGSYQLNDFTFSLGYQKSHLSNLAALDVDDLYDLDGFTGGMRQDQWVLGMQYAIGAGTIKASFNHADAKSSEINAHTNKYALGYTYDLSKRTSLYGVVSYTDNSNDQIGAIYNNNGVEKDSVTGIQIGMTHNF